MAEAWRLIRATEPEALQDGSKVRNEGWRGAEKVGSLHLLQGGWARVQGEHCLPCSQRGPSSCSAENGQNQEDQSVVAIQGRGNGPGTRLCQHGSESDSSLLCALLSKSGADGCCPGEGQGQNKEEREGRQAMRGDIKVVQDSGTK